MTEVISYEPRNDESLDDEREAFIRANEQHAQAISIESLKAFIYTNDAQIGRLPEDTYND